jgi:hypothetical protein
MPPLQVIVKRRISCHAARGRRGSEAWPTSTCSFPSTATTCSMSIGYAGSSMVVRRWTSAAATRSSSPRTSTNGSSRPARPRPPMPLSRRRSPKLTPCSSSASSSTTTVVMSATRRRPRRRSCREEVAAGQAMSVGGREGTGARAAAMVSNRGRGGACWLAKESCYSWWVT